MGLDIYFEVRNNKTGETHEIGYFRKVNFLVGFFDRINEGLDNLEPVAVSKEDIELLISCCEEVLEDHDLAPEILPVTQGFFFGSYEYDQYYFDDVQEVLVYCKEDLLPMFDKLDEDEEIIFNIWY